MNPDIATVLQLVKARLNRLPADTSLDAYLTIRIEGAWQELNRMMHADLDLTDSPADLLLLTDYAVWQYQCRDNPGSQPDWLRKRLKERFLQRGAAP